MTKAKATKRAASAKSAAKPAAKRSPKAGSKAAVGAASAISPVEAGQLPSAWQNAAQQPSAQPEALVEGNSGLLASKSVLVTLNVRQWTARKLDKRVTQEVLDKHNADENAGRFNKQLLSKSALETLGKVEGKARTLHYKLTVPWSDQGQRLLSSVGYLDYVNQMNALKREYDAAIDAFVAGYPLFVAEARVALNGMFNEMDYPPIERIMGKFEFTFDFDNVPSSNDLRVDIGEAQLDEIKNSIETRASKRVAAMQLDVFNRIATATGKMVEKLRTYKPAAEGNKPEGIFRDSLVENIRELVQLLPSLNIADNPVIKQLGEQLLDDCCQFDAEDLRESDGIRQKVADKAEAILNKARGFLA